MENDRNYFMRRAAQERSAATKAGDSKVRALHEMMADRYHQLAGSALPEAAANAVTAD